MSIAASQLPAPVRSIYPVVRVIASFIVMSIGGAGMFAAIVALKPISLEFGVSRAAASSAYTLTMVGFGLGGIVMGWVSDRIGVMWPTLFASLCYALGFALAGRADSLWEIYLAHGVLIGFFGCSATFAPLIADTSHWFGRRRGIAVAFVISGNYLAGALWPPILQHFFDAYGWRMTYTVFASFSVCTMFALALFLAPSPPATSKHDAADHESSGGRPIGLAPVTLQCLICAAGIGCCVAMAVPQVHIVAYASDLGFEPARGAEMLAIMLGTGVVSRLGFGWFSDRIGGLKTLLLGSTAQAVMIALFIPFDGLTALYVLSALFGLSQGGIVPAYAIIIRQFFPASQAGWRIGVAMLFTMLGMAFGGWLAGAIFDLTGGYGVAFAVGVLFNLGNMGIAAFLLVRHTRRRRTSLAAVAA